MKRRTEAAATLLAALFQLLRALKSKRASMKPSERRLVDYDLAMMVHIGSDLHKYLSWSDLSIAEIQGFGEGDCTRSTGDYAEKFMQDINYAITMLQSWPFDNPLIGRQVMKRLYELQSYYSDQLAHDDEFIIGNTTSEQASWEQKLAVGADIHSFNHEQGTRPTSNPDDNYILTKIGSWTSVKKLNDSHAHQGRSVKQDGQVTAIERRRI
ncbi:hypothetical protein [Paenibacillus agilis]|uniref:Uncharacterized protein n=1 Tax=Paenibacillus agilis TaxID=3020863 RepID=A0A559IVQ3_9BACL|nr:hypothetical protein [Paenibacillus agilis]TVX91683.1 hypothetical protein FPZ44_00595 [Paenibacillus agilis]